jgi:hypothetical protein
VYRADLLRLLVGATVLRVSWGIVRHKLLGHRPRRRRSWPELALAAVGGIAAGRRSARLARAATARERAAIERHAAETETYGEVPY